MPLDAKVVVAALGAICLALAIAGSASRNYYVTPVLGSFSGYGLWETGTGSTKYAINDNVKKLSDVVTDSKLKSKLQAAQAFGILGALASAASIAAGFLQKPEQKKVTLIALFAFAAFSGVIVLAVYSMGSVYADQPKPSGLEYGAAFGICICISLFKKYQCHSVL